MMTSSTTRFTPRLSAPVAFSFAILVGLAVLALKWVVFPAIGMESRFLPLIGGVIVVSWIGGMRAGLVTLALIGLGDVIVAMMFGHPIHIGDWTLFLAVAGVVTLAFNDPYRFLLKTDGVDHNHNHNNNHAESVFQLQQERDQHRETGAALNVSQGMFEQLVKSVEDYAIFMLDPNGIVMTWNLGAKRIKGYADHEIIGKSFINFYSAEDQANGKPLRGLETARREGHFEDEGWRMRKDGTRFWASVVLTALRDDNGELIGFAKVTRDNTHRRIAEQALQQAKNELEQRVMERATANKELEAFSYSVSHDLRAPLRHLIGFSQALREDYTDQLDDEGRLYLKHIEESGQRMEGLIDELLKLSQLTSNPLKVEEIDLSVVALEIANELRMHLDHKIEFMIGEVPIISGDLTLLRVVLYNLMDNAAKFSARNETPKVEFGCNGVGERAQFFVRDNGVGFDPKYADRLFGPFQRLHAKEDFAGTGIGLATCQRILRRHGGRIWAEASPNQGATFHFTIGDVVVD